MICSIVCVAFDAKNPKNKYNWGIGKKNGLLFEIPEDMKFFRNTTKGHTVVCGYNTLLSLPNSKPLPNRKTIVLCPEDKEPEGCIVYHDFDKMVEDVIELAEVEDIYVIGGGMMYKSMLPYCDTMLVTKVDAIDEETAIFYPNLDEDNTVKCVEESEIQESNGYKFRFTKYIRIK